MKTDILYGMVPCSKTRLKCVLCGVHVPKATRCIEQHAKGAKHHESMRFMKDNGMFFKDEALHCKPCDMKLSVEESVINHIEGHEHGNWLAAIEDLTEGEFVVLDSYLSLESENAFCRVCNVPIRCSLPILEAHVNSPEHRQNICNFLSPRNGLFVVMNGEKIWCKVCDIYFENDVKFILNHLDEDIGHLHWFMDVEDLIQDQQVSIAEYLTVEKETKAFCHKCDVDMNCCPNAIEAHVHSESHLFRFL